MPEKKCPVHGRMLERPTPIPVTFAWATGYSSLENITPIPPLRLGCPEKGCDYREDLAKT